MVRSAQNPSSDDTPPKQISARVSFNTPQGDCPFGTLVKSSPKTVTVMTDNGQRWNISPHLLTPVKEAAVTLPAGKLVNKRLN